MNVLLPMWAGFALSQGIVQLTRGETAFGITLIIVGFVLGVAGGAYFVYDMMMKDYGHVIRPERAEQKRYAEILKARKANGRRS
jgi:hypothetical protein